MLEMGFTGLPGLEEPEDPWGWCVSLVMLCLDPNISQCPSS